MANRSLPEMPCGPILELHGQRKRFHIPFGLKALLEEMTKEVLRTQPANIYDFLATFMEARLKKKKEAEAKAKGRKSWEVHRWSWQGKSILEPEELKELLEEFHTPLEEANHHAVVIQAAFRGYQARKKVKELRKSLEAEGHGGEAGDGQPKKAETEKHGEGDDDEENVKGWKVRKWSKGRKSVLPPDDLKEFLEELDHEGISREKVEEKAVVIQAAFRGYQARKKVKDLKKSLAHTGEEGEEHKPEEATEQVGTTTTATGTESTTQATTATDSAVAEPSASEAEVPDSGQTKVEETVPPSTEESKAQSAIEPTTPAPVEEAKAQPAEESGTGGEPAAPTPDPTPSTEGAANNQEPTSAEGTEAPTQEEPPPA